MIWSTTPARWAASQVLITSQSAALSSLWGANASSGWRSLISDRSTTPTGACRATRHMATQTVTKGDANSDDAQQASPPAGLTSVLPCASELTAKADMSIEQRVQAVEAQLDTARPLIKKMQAREALLEDVKYYSTLILVVGVGGTLGLIFSVMVAFVAVSLPFPANVMFFFWMMKQMDI